MHTFIYIVTHLLPYTYTHIYTNIHTFTYTYTQCIHDPKSCTVRPPSCVCHYPTRQGLQTARKKSRPPQVVFWQNTTAVMTASSGVWQIPSPEMQEPKSPVQGWPLCGPLVSCIPSCSLHLMVQSPLRVIIDISRHPQYSDHDFPRIQLAY